MSNTQPASAYHQAIWQAMQAASDQPALYNMPLCYEWLGHFDSQRFWHAWQQLIACQPALRTQFAVKNEQLVQVVLPQALLLARETCQNDFTARSFQALANQVINVQVAPLLQCHVIRLPKKRTLIMLVCHHLIMDGPSVEVLWRQFFDFYAGRTVNSRRETSLPAVDPAHQAYWQKLWASGIPETMLPGYKTSNFSHAGGNFSMLLPQALASQIKATVKIPLFSFFLGIYALLLARYGSSKSVAIATPVSLRSYGQREAIGLWVNTLLLKLVITEPTSTFLDTVAATVMEGLAHRHAPLMHSDVKTMFLYEEDGSSKQLKRLKFPSTIAKYPLTLTVSKDSECFILDVEYSTAQFNEEDISLFLDEYSHFVQQVLTGKNFSQLELLERNQSISVGPVNKEPLKHFLDQFHCMAYCYGSRVAVDDGDNSINYAMLKAGSLRLASWLRLKGIQPGARVAICASRKAYTLKALLAIWYCRAVWVPIDPLWPEAHRDKVLCEAKPKLVLTDALLQQNFSAYFDLSNNDWQLSDMAYQIYTSGSTGEPKAVTVSHRNLSHYLLHAESYVRSGIGAPVFSSLGFDLTITALLAPLTAGKTVFMLPQEPGIKALIGWLSTVQNPSFIKVTPSHLQLLKKHVPKARWLQLQTVLVIGGEQLYAQQCAFLPANIVCINEYGPTETTVGVSTYKVRQKTGVAPIGQPIINTRFSAHDKHGNICPKAVIGELYIAGPSVAGKPVYQTGDLVLMNSDGHWVFMGRKDNQVKIKGHRVNLSIISEQLRQLKGVAHAEVSYVNEQLRAYISGDTSLSRIFFQRQLANYLPHYMLPSQYFKVESFPLTVNGKVDHHQLLTANWPEFAVANIATEKLQPILVVWETVFSRKIQADTNFYQLGGDSIAALSLAAEANRQGFDLSFTEILANPTPRLLATTAKSTTSLLPTIEEGKPFALTPIQQWFFKHYQINPNGYLQTLLLKVAQPLSWKIVHQAIQQLVNAHSALRLKFLRHQGQWKQQIAKTIELPITMVKNRSLSQAAAEAYQKIDISKGRLWQLVWVRQQQTTYLLWVCHHLIIDAVSWRILQADLLTLLKGREITTPVASYQHWQAYLSKLKEEAAFWKAQGSHAKQLHFDDIQHQQIVLPVPLVADKANWLLVRWLLAIHQCLHLSKITLQLEHHARNVEGLDFSRTLGWFTSLFPCQFDLKKLSTLAFDKAIELVRETIAKVPDQGRGYAVLPHLNSPYCFNFLGDFSENSPQLTEVNDELPSAIAAENGSPYMLELNAWITEQVLTIEVAYSKSGLGERIVALIREMEKPCIYPLLPGQQVLLAKAQEYKNDPLVTVVYWHYFGELDLKRLNNAWRRLFQMYPQLTFRLCEDGQSQDIAVKPEIQVLNWDAHVAGILNKFLSALQAKTYPLDKCKAHQALLLKLQDRHTFIWRHHHLWLDGWSVTKCYQQLHEFYQEAA